MHVRTIPRSHGILKRIMQLAEGIPGWNVECAFDDGVGGTDEGEVECISIPFRRKEKQSISSKFLKEWSFDIDTHLPQYFLWNFQSYPHQRKHKKSAIDPISKDPKKTHPLLASLTTIYRLRLRASTAGTTKFALIRAHHRRAT